MPSSTRAAQGRKSAKRAFEDRYSARFIMGDSHGQVTGDTNVPARDFDELWIALGGPDSRHMADEPEEKTGEPKAQTEAECCGQGAVYDGNGPRRTAHQD